ncbi:hypothetical protein BU23DRAFT_474884 [Bimuria novae-zelandiae CBS 107.79]|uniref:PHD-type domain-containing protein n=1 Tax=Bimuria novae-zelandiae CBS 107.79 TaxID=1447943 RepID=A0A6A5UYH0_9PLEO|nr:hypothetical protein BU23DRAFT_474884 [Bimuria novae-zelandiae CBS 107.79]
MAEEAVAPEEPTPPPQPVANPDAQTTVNDFLDYTEFFPSDLVRSLRLIGDLDKTYIDATQAVHQLTLKYGKLPTIPASERPDPVALRKQIAQALDNAIYARESSYAEASRLYEVAERHKHRIGIIKRKLQAQPEPPSRDPTPVPVSPQAPRLLNRSFATPHLRLTFDGRHGGSSTARSRDRKKLPGVRIRTASFSDSDDSEVRSNPDAAAAPKRLKDRQEKAPKPQKVRVRPPGSGTNVHSSFAGISTSNALARLSPPPDNARPGSRWAPWFKLTEYEMAVLRKKMKKNAVWTPSETMIKRVLEAGKRGQEAYEREKRRCEEAGEEFLDEEPAAPSLRSKNPPAAESTPAAKLAGAVIASASTDALPTSVEPRRDTENGELDALQGTLELRDTRQSTRDSQRRQAARDAQELENTTRRIKEAADWMQELSFSTLASYKKPPPKPSHKRKRDSTPEPTVETPREATREPSLASQDSEIKPPESKRLRSNPSAASAGASTPQNLTPIAHSPGVKTPVPFPETSKTTTTQVPLAPAGPGTPTSVGIPPAAVASQPSTPVATSPAVETAAEAPTSPTVAPPAPAHSHVTAASSRPRRESVAPPKAEPASPPPISEPPARKQKAATPAPEAGPPAPVPATRARTSRPSSSRGHVPTPKAQSEEPKPNEQGQSAREHRRHSIFTQSAIAAPTPASTRTSTRRKPPPKGEITNGEGGQKTVTKVNRAQGNKNKKKKKPEEDSEPVEDIDQDAERYCICDDVSYGSMILCDNHCEKEWFHLECVGLKDGELPARRAKWYCPDCREALGTDAYGNPKVPPPLPGRRGNR